MKSAGTDRVQSRSARATLVANTTYNAAGRFWDAAVNLALAAYIVPKVGLAGWGLWVLAGAFTGYVALFDLGMGSGFARYIAEFAAKDEGEKVSAVVSTGLFVHLCLGALLVAVFWPLVNPIIGIAARLAPNNASLHEPEFLHEVRLLLCGGVLLYVCSNCVSPFTAVQTGLQRMGITNALSFVASWVKIGATVAFLEADYGVRGLLYAQAVVLSFFAAANVAIAFRLVPALRVSPRAVSREIFSLLFGFGWKTQVVRLCGIVAFQTDKVVVGAVYRQLDLVGVYRIGEELASKMRQVPVLLLTAIIPAAADLDARGEDERLRLLYLRSTKYVAAVTIPLAAFIIGASGPIIRAWMGDVPHLEIAACVNRIIAAGYIANIIPGAGISIVLGKGRPEIQMFAGVIETVANIALTIALAFTIGFYGVPLGTALAMVLSCVYVMRAMRRHINVAPGEILRRALMWPAVAAAPGLLACSAAGRLAAGYVGRVPNAVAVISSGALLAGVYVAILWMSPFFDSFDREFLRQCILRRGTRQETPLRKAADE